MSVPLIDLTVTSGDHLMLNVRLPNEQLWHGAFVAVFGDASNSEVFGPPEDLTDGLEQLCLALVRLSPRVVQES